MLSFFLRDFTLLFLWILFLEIENKVFVETKAKCVFVLHSQRNEMRMKE